MKSTKERKDWSYFNFQAGRYLPTGWEWGLENKLDKDFEKYIPNSINTTSNKLSWYVFNEEMGKIVPIDIFQYNWVFLVDLVRIKKKYGHDFIKFADATRSALQHQYWARSEYETVITSWPPYVNNAELDRLNQEREDRIVKGYTFYRESANLECGYKIDIYSQLMLNWDAFINYVWANKKLITPKKLGVEKVMSRKRR